MTTSGGTISTEMREGKRRVRGSDPSLNGLLGRDLGGGWGGGGGRREEGGGGRWGRGRRQGLEGGRALVES